MAGIRRFPPGFSMRILTGTPQRHRLDMLQEAWLAYCMGRNPNTAARNYVSKVMRNDGRESTLSQLTIKQRSVVRCELDLPDEA